MASPGATLERRVTNEKISVPDYIPDYDSLPLSDILQPPHLRGEPDSKKLVVSKHESQHMFAAIDWGVAINYLSCEPVGDADGVTVLLGYVPIETMQVIAAASTVKNDHYSPVGTGSDRYKVRIGEFMGGTTASNAMDKAAAAVKGVPGELFARVALLISFMGYVSGDQIPSVIARAKAELEIEARLAGITYEEKYEISKEYQFVEPTTSDITKNKREDNKKESTEIITDKNGDRKVVWKAGEKIIREEAICNSCGGIGSHYNNCPILNVRLKPGESNTQNPGLSPEPKSKDKSVSEFFPVSPPTIEPEGTIFDGNELLV